MNDAPRTATPHQLRFRRSRLYAVVGQSSSAHLPAGGNQSRPRQEDSRGKAGQSLEAARRASSVNASRQGR